MLTCQGMEEKEGRRGEEVGRWHGTVMDAGGRLLELIEKLCNEYSNVNGSWKGINEFTDIKDLEQMGKPEVGEQKEGGRKEGEQKEWGMGERKEGHMEERKLGERRTHQLHVQAEYLKQLAEGVKKVEGRCNLPPYSSIIAGDCITFNNTLTLAVQSVQAYPTFTQMLTSEGLSAVLPGAETLEEGLAVYHKFYSEEKEHRAGVLALRVEPTVTGMGGTEDFQQPCGTGDVDGRQADATRSQADVAVCQADVAICQADVKSQLEPQLASLIHRILVVSLPPFLLQPFPPFPVTAQPSHSHLAPFPVSSQIPYLHSTAHTHPWKALGPPGVSLNSSNVLTTYSLPSHTSCIFKSQISQTPNSHLSAHTHSWQAVGPQEEQEEQVQEEKEKQEKQEKQEDKDIFYMETRWQQLTHRAHIHLLAPKAKNRQLAHTQVHCCNKQLNHQQC
ncbi:unnamed protein product [Closterium sp. NIES-64]|nr:unnamed protein product [Closterium sp. NIES-64]